jgi:hypothetical protein
MRTWKTAEDQILSSLHTAIFVATKQDKYAAQHARLLASLIHRLQSYHFRAMIVVSGVSDWLETPRRAFGGLL